MVDWMYGLDSRKLLMIVIFIFLSVPLKARVKGPCSNCHTMHNYQNGEVIDIQGPRNYLLKSSCAGCHTNPNGSETIIAIGGTVIPIVNTSLEPTRSLAGGNFYWVRVGGDRKGHNCLSVPGVGEDQTLLQAPGKPSSASGPSCSGCHDRISGCKSCHDPKHHADDSSTVVGESGGWYRFLNSPEHGSSSTGVIGIEDSDWEYTVSSTDHNEYNGCNNVYGYDDNSISNYCAGCHQGFHGLSNTDTDGSIIYDNVSPWFRHPTHLAIPNDPGKEYYYYNNPGGSGPGPYNPLVPVARDPNQLSTMTGPSSTVTPGSDQVMCLSCHRAHASPYDHLLRWDYNGWPQNGDDNGCTVCHTAKN